MHETHAVARRSATTHACTRNGVRATTSVYDTLCDILDLYTTFAVAPMPFRGYARVLALCLAITCDSCERWHTAAIARHPRDRNASCEQALNVMYLRFVSLCLSLFELTVQLKTLYTQHKSLTVTTERQRTATTTTSPPYCTMQCKSVS